MGVTEVVHGSLKINIPVGSKLSAELDKCDIDRNGTVSRDDFNKLFENTSIEGYADYQFRNCVTTALYNAGEITQNQKGAFNRFLTTFSDVEKASELARNWASNRLDETSPDRLFDEDYFYRRIGPHFLDGGVFEEYGKKLAANIANIYFSFSNGSLKGPGSFGLECGYKIYLVTYSPKDLPPIIRDGFKQMLGIYAGIKEAVGDNKFLACDGCYGWLSSILDVGFQVFTLSIGDTVDTPKIVQTKGCFLRF